MFLTRPIRRLTRYDDRGQELRATPLDDHLDPTTISAAVERYIAGKVSGTASALGPMALTAVPVFLGVAFLAGIGVQFGLPPWSLYPLVILASVLNLAIWRRVMLKRQEREIRRFYLDHGVCVGCNYPISGLQRDADGCVVCPECAAAWWVPERTMPLPSLQFGASIAPSRLVKPKLMIAPDSAGRLVHLAECDVGRFPSRHWPSIPEPERRAMAGELRKLAGGARLPQVVIGAVICIGALLFLAFMKSPRGFWDVLGALLIAITGGWAVVNAFLYAAPVDPKDLISLFERWGRCASCAAKLPTGLPRLQSLPCAECGAVWGAAPPISPPAPTIPPPPPPGAAPSPPSHP